MTHAGIFKEEKERDGLPDSLIRPSAGTEDVDNLLTGPEQAIGWTKFSFDFKPRPSRGFLLLKFHPKYSTVHPWYMPNEGNNLLFQPF